MKNVSDIILKFEVIVTIKAMKCKVAIFDNQKYHTAKKSFFSVLKRIVIKKQQNSIHTVPVVSSNCLEKVADTVSLVKISTVASQW